MNIIHIVLGFYSCYLQYYDGPQYSLSIGIMILSIGITLVKTLFYMKIFKSFSFMVTMLFRVILDLKNFILFYIILIIMFSMAFNVIAPPSSPEYSEIGEIAGSFLATMRISLGDFDFSALQKDELSER